MMANEKPEALVARNEELIKRAYSEAMKAHKSKEKFLRKPSAEVIIYSFPGSWSVTGWYGDKSTFGEKEIDLQLFPSMRSFCNDKNAQVNEAFESRLKSILEKLERKVQKDAEEKKQIVFTGHSSGGPIAVLATIWLLEKARKQNINISTPPLCVTFGSPLVGNHIFAHALRRQNWSNHFIHFVTRFDIVPRVFLAPRPTNIQHFETILKSLSGRSKVPDQLAQDYFEEVMRNVLTLTSHVACKLMENTNLLLETLTSFIELSPYRPFGVYAFSDGPKKLVTLDNSNAVLQLLFYSCQPSVETEVSDIAKRSLEDHHTYETQLQTCHKDYNSGGAMKSDTYQMDTINKAADVFELSTSGRLCLMAAGELEEQKKRNLKTVEEKYIEMEKTLKDIESYKTNCELHKLGYYDSFKHQKSQKDFNANVKRLVIAGIWDEILEMLKGYKLPDEFEGQEKWIARGTRHRRLVEPLDIANFYRHLKNEDTGSYMAGGRPKRYKFPQRWYEHDKQMGEGDSGESCFWAEVEELCNNGNKDEKDKKIQEQKVDKAKKIQERVLQWKKDGVIGNDVFLRNSTFVKWWDSLPLQIKANGIEPLVHG
ncbi:protein EDS1L-like [Humulus lupulus]|uniref:protein EDS1L-like n=1 Tax=Humulus lupulus TaxID=3486 RepID=UPI002B40A133|nr:protein EDS1L-like [Humulus lupulus]